MKRTMVFFLLVGVFTVSALGLPTASHGGSGSRGVRITQEDAGTTLYLRPHQVVTVSLPGNRTTGYSWEVVSSSGLDRQGEPEFVADGNGIGSGGTFLFSFMATSPGTGGLKMVYRRPWETGEAPLKSFEITAIITDW